MERHSVDLPEPEGPIVDRHVDVLQGVEVTVVLVDVLDLDNRDHGH